MMHTNTRYVSKGPKRLAMNQGSPAIAASNVSKKRQIWIQAAALVAASAFYCVMYSSG